jgi:hypothetical protein
MSQLIRRARRAARIAGRRSVFLVLLLAPAAALAGCAIFGVAASKLASVKVAPAYHGLPGQTVGVMVVVTDRGLQNDFPRLPIDAGRGIQSKIQNAIPTAGNELKGVRFLPDKSPEAMYAFEQNYPELMFEPATTIAPRLGVSRLIYIEVESFQTHPESVPELYRGMISARLQVVEVTNGKAKVGYEERMQSSYPKQSPEEGMPALGESKTYQGTLEAFTSAVLEKFVTHDEENH